MKHWVILAGLALAGCVPATPAITPEQQAELDAYHPPPAGYPPKMGIIRGKLDGKTVNWETYDFSIGAYDASAWVGFSDGVQTLHLRGLPPGKPNSETGAIFITADIAGERKLGALSNVLVLIPSGKDWQGPGLSSAGQTATLEIIGIEAPKREQSDYGSAGGKVMATLCPVNGATGPCQELAITFSTEMQFDATGHDD